MDELMQFYSEKGPERVGLILDDGQIVELENICPDPEGFAVKPEDMVVYEERAVATWHTHPGADNNLSTGDYIGFQNWPRLRHYIVGTNGVKCYEVRDGKIVQNV